MGPVVSEQNCPRCERLESMAEKNDKNKMQWNWRSKRNEAPKDAQGPWFPWSSNEKPAANREAEWSTVWHLCGVWWSVCFGSPWAKEMIRFLQAQTGEGLVENLLAACQQGFPSFCKTINETAGSQGVKHLVAGNELSLFIQTLPIALESIYGAGVSQQVAARLGKPPFELPA